MPVQIAGAYLNLEPVVGAGLGWLAFGDVAAFGQVAGAAAVLAGILISTVASNRRPRSSAEKGSGLPDPLATRSTIEFPAIVPRHLSSRTRRTRAIRGFLLGEQVGHERGGDEACVFVARG